MPDLLTTKLFIPRRRPDSVERTRLTDRLLQGMDRKLTLVTAPAGFGKTTLLSEWIPQSECCVTWVSIDRGDNDPTRFWGHFIAAVQTVSADTGKKALDLLQCPQPPPIEAILTLLLNEISDFREGFAQVLDDYQVIHSQRIHSAISFFLEHMPPHMHLVIAGRTDPPLPLARLAARNQLSEIRAADLRFSPEETAVFLNQTMGLNLSTESIASLETFTEGWIAGLQLAALALRDQDVQPDANRVSEFIQAFSGSYGHIASYLVEEVLNQRPKGTMDFLLQTSILDSLSGPLCDSVLGKSSNLHSQAILEQLVRANLFIVPLDVEGKWFRYHHLFAEVLRARLQKYQPDKLRELHLRAAEWYEAAGSIREAVRHCLEAGEWECAARLIETNAILFASKGQFQLVLGWLTGFPESVIRSHPLLSVVYAGALIRNNRLEDAAARLRDAEEGIQVDTPAGQARLILGRVSMVRSGLLRIQGTMRGSIEHARQALELLPESDIVTRADAALNLAHGFLISGDVNHASEDLVTSVLASARASGMVYIAARATILLARLCALQGRLHRSEEIYVEAISVQNEASLLAGIPDYFFGLGDLNREWNELDESEGILGQGVVQARSYLSDGDALMHGYESLARLKQAQGDTQGARATLVEFIQLAQQHHLSDELLAGVRAVQAWLDLMADNDSAAAQWADTRGMQVDDELSFPHEREYLTLARLFIRRGRDRPENEDAGEALRLLRRLGAAAQAGGRMGSLIEILALQAMAFQVLGDHREALRSIEQALALAGPEGYMRVFLDEGEPMRSLIAEARTSFAEQSAERSPVPRWPDGKQPDGSITPLSYAGQLLAAFPRATPTALAVSRRAGEVRAKPAIEDLLESLSDRELTVLHLIATGASNAEIAETLIISVSTVKRHTGNLYDKLGVNSRTQAIARAQQIGLLT